MRSSPCSCKDLEVFIGLLHWVLRLAPSLRPWLRTLYRDKARPVGTNFSLTRAVWQQLKSYLNEEMQFACRPPGTRNRAGSRLLSVRHVPINALDDLRLVRNTRKRLCGRAWLTCQLASGNCRTLAYVFFCNFAKHGACVLRSFDRWPFPR